MRRGIQDEILDEEEEIWGFVHEKVVVTQQYPNVSEQMWEEYITLNGKSWTADEMNEVFHGDLTKNLHNSFLNDEKILALFKALRIKFDEYLVHLYQKRTCAKLKVRNDILIDYRLAGNPESVKSPPKRYVQVPPPPPQQQVPPPALPPQRRDPPPPLPPQRRDPPQLRNSPPPLPRRQDSPQRNESSPIVMKPKNDEITPELEKDMWKFVQKNFGRVSNNQFVMQSFWVKFAQSKNLPGALSYDLTKHFRTMFGKIYSMPIELKIKMGLMKDLKFKMTRDVELKLLSVYNVEVEIDDDGFIENWKLCGSKTVEARQAKKQKNATERENETRTTRRNAPNAQPSSSSRNIQTWRPQSRNNVDDDDDDDADAQRG